MAFDLQDRGLDLGCAEHLLQAIGLEVGKPNRPHAPVLDRTFHVLPGSHVVAELLVEQKQVDIAGAEAVEHLVNGLARHAFAVLARPELARDPHILARYAALAHRLPYAALVLVDMRRVDVTVSQ